MAPLPPAPVKANCPNCGVIETVREVEKAGKYQTAVRFENRYTQVFVKVANTPAGLNATTLTRYGPFITSPTDLVAAGVPVGKHLRVEFVLTSADGISTPALRSYSVVWKCAGSIN